MGSLKVFIGWDPREQDAYAVCEASLRKHSTIALDVQPLMLEPLRRSGLYTRPTEMRDGRLWDVISDAPMSTEFALTRFCVPLLAQEGWALYCDCDFLWRADVAELLGYADPADAVRVVQHVHRPPETLKMDGQRQTDYPRKNWSSLVLWNCAHKAHAGQAERLARWPGLWLQQFRWLMDGWIGGPLPIWWNWLEGVSPARSDPSAVHYTRGVPSMPGYENAAFADEWRKVLEEARCASASSVTA